MNFKLGEINNLLVGRKTDIGYMLFNNNKEEILIHFNQIKGDIKEGDYIDAFVYTDGDKRITATMETPFIKVNEPGFVTVKSSMYDYGVFINNNTVKDPLISYDDLPSDFEKWPIAGDIVFAKLKNTGTQLIAKLVTPEEMKEYLNATTTLEKFQKVSAIVTKSGEEGINLVTKEGHFIFVYYKHKRRDYHIGELVEVTIINIKDDKTYNGSFLETKENLIDTDANIILNYIKEHNDYMTFTSKSDVKDIEKTFKMSKAAFKRALGTLYKERLVEIKEDGTYLVK